jgi:N-acetylglutamate synthase/N-acetylornithine aminotransferase
MTIETIEGGHATTPQGFYAGAVCAGMYASGPKAGGLDLGILYSDRECTSGGVLTRNMVRSAPVRLARRPVPAGHPHIAAALCAGGESAGAGVIGAGVYALCFGASRARKK